MIVVILFVALGSAAVGSFFTLLAAGLIEIELRSPDEDDRAEALTALRRIQAR